MAQHKNVTALNILMHARGIIAPAQCWTKGAPARTEDGFSTGASMSAATCWCATGAIDRTCDRLRLDPDGADEDGYLLALRLLSDQCPQEPHFGPDDGRSDTAYRVAIQDSNDYQGITHERVLGWFDAAISEARALRAAVMPRTCRHCGGMGTVLTDDGRAKRCDRCAGTGRVPHMAPTPRMRRGS